MKKYGKYEKRPEGVPAKQPKVKSALLQTYLTSLLCMVLCVTMFFGTSYAWFTSEVNNTANEIYIGTLDVGLFAGEKDLSDSNNKLFDANIRWEPGYTALETIQIVNEGDLAFKYVLSFTEGAAKDAEDQEVTLADVAKYFDVWVYDYYDHGNVAPTLTTYKAIAQENSGWVYGGSLDQLLDGKVVLEGNMLTVRDEATGETVATADTYTIALHMKEDADESIMGHKLSLNVKLVAYQKSSEADDLGITDYDQLVATEKDLREAFQNGGHITLLEDIVLTEGVSVPADKTVVLDLNDHSISQEKECTDSYSMITNNGTLTVKDSGNEGKITFKDTGVGDSSFGWGSYTIGNYGTLVIESGTIENLTTLNETSVQHMYCAIHQGWGAKSTTINGGKISAPTYRSIRVNNGAMFINAGEMDGQVWMHPFADDTSLAITGGEFSPNGVDYSSVYVENGSKTVNVTISGGNFSTKIGVANPDVLAGCITGGEFTAEAKTNTASILFAS